MSLESMSVSLKSGVAIDRHSEPVACRIMPLLLRPYTGAIAPTAHHTGKLFRVATVDVELRLFDY